jgi:hypothetical protein
VLNLRREVNIIPELVRRAAKFVASTTNPRLRNRTLRWLNQLSKQPEIDQVCQVWYVTRHTKLAELVAAHAWVATTPLEVKVLSALQANKPEILAKQDVEIVELLVRLYWEEGDLMLARRAADYLEGVQDPTTINVLCAAWKHGHPLLTEIAERKDFLISHSSGLRVLLALKATRPELLVDGGTEIIEPLLQLCQDNDPVLAEQARLTLSQVTQTGV